MILTTVFPPQGSSLYISDRFSMSGIHLSTPGKHESRQSNDALLVGLLNVPPALEVKLHAWNAFARGRQFLSRTLLLLTPSGKYHLPNPSSVKLLHPGLCRLPLN
jgi:hypothetical protein